MKKEFFVQKSRFSNNTFLVIPSPVYDDLSSLIGDLEKFDFHSRNFKIRIDLVLITGDRKGRFIELSFQNQVLNSSSLKVIDNDDELSKMMKNVYSNLPLNLINSIYPIKLREEVLILKERERYRP